MYAAGCPLKCRVLHAARRTEHIVQLRLGECLQLRGSARVCQAAVDVQQRRERRRECRADRKPGRDVRLPEQARCAAGSLRLSMLCCAAISTQQVGSWCPA